MAAEQKVTPWEAHAADGATKIDFEKLIRENRFKRERKLVHNNTLSVQVSLAV